MNDLILFLSRGLIQVLNCIFESANFRPYSNFSVALSAFLFPSAKKSHFFLI